MITVFLAGYGACWLLCARFLFRRWTRPTKELHCRRDHSKREYSGRPSYDTCCVKAASRDGLVDTDATWASMAAALLWPFIVLAALVRCNIKRPAFTQRKRPEILTGKALARAERDAGLEPGGHLD